MVPRGWFRKGLFHEKFWQVKYYSHTLKTIGTYWPIQVSTVVLSCPTRLNPDCHSTELKVSASKCLYRRERTGPKRLSAVQKLHRKKTVSGWMLQAWNSSWDWSKLWAWCLATFFILTLDVFVKFQKKLNHNGEPDLRRQWGNHLSIIPNKWDVVKPVITYILAFATFFSCEKNITNSSF